MYKNAQFNVLRRDAVCCLIAMTIELPADLSVDLGERARMTAVASWSSRYSIGSPRLPDSGHDRKRRHSSVSGPPRTCRIDRQDPPPGQNLWHMRNGINSLEGRSRQLCHSAEKSRDESGFITDRLLIRRSVHGE